MKIQIKPFYFAIFMFVFSACEQDATVEPPKYDKKPFIVSLISPESQDIFAEIKYTQPYFGQQTLQDECILDAHVRIIDLTDPDTSEMPLQNSIGIYKTTQFEIKVVENHVYKLEVKTSNGRIFSALTTVPPKADLSQFKITYLKVGQPILDSSGKGPGGPGGPGVFYERNPFTLDYYYKGGLNKKFYMNMQFEAEMQNASNEILPVELVNRGNNDFYRSNDMGQIRVFLNRDFNSGFGVNGPWEVSRISGTVYTVDEAYKNYYLSQDNNSSGDFFSEPILMISNWSEGSIGFFGSYNFIKGTIYTK